MENSSKIQPFKEVYQCRFCGQKWGFYTTTFTRRVVGMQQAWHGEIALHVAGHLFKWSKMLVVYGEEVINGGGSYDS